MKIIICYNNPNRELAYLNELKSLLLNNKDVDNVILVNGGDTKKVISSVFKLKPKIILTYPLTGKSLPYKFYILKLIFKFKLICLRTEGAIEKENRNNVLAHVGIANYPKNLVDLELFWGQIQREILGQELVAQKKISSIDRCLVVGYPRINLYTGKKKK